MSIGPPAVQNLLLRPRKACHCQCFKNKLFIYSNLSFIQHPLLAAALTRPKGLRQLSDFRADTHWPPFEINLSELHNQVKEFIVTLS